MWYKREEALRRFSIFFNSVTLAGAFGSLLASAIQNMDGIQGHRGWRWIFILEGLLTMVLGILAFFILLGFPEDAKWLEPEERMFLQARLLVDDKEKMQPVSTASGLRTFFSDYKAYLGALLYFGELLLVIAVPSSFTHRSTRGQYSRLQPKLFPPYHRQRVPILGNPDTIAQRPAICSRVGILGHKLFYCSQNTPRTSLRYLPSLSRIRGRRHSSQHPYIRPPRICGFLPPNNGPVWRIARGVVLVCDEFRRAF